MWSEILTAVWCSAIVAGVVYYYATMKGYDEGMHDVLEYWKQTEVQDAREQRERLERERGVVDPRGRVPLLGWVAVVPGTKGEEPGESAGDAGSERLEGGQQEAREVSDDQVVELEEWFRTKERQDDPPASR